MIWQSEFLWLFEKMTFIHFPQYITKVTLWTPIVASPWPKCSWCVQTWNYTTMLACYSTFMIFCMLIWIHVVLKKIFKHIPNVKPMLIFESPTVAPWGQWYEQIQIFSASGKFTQVPVFSAFLILERNIFEKTSSHFHYFLIIFFSNKTRLFISTNKKPIHPRMICDKFGWT